MNDLQLSGAQKRNLKSNAHHLKALVQMGKDGASQGFVKELDSQLKIHELLKFRVLNNCLEEADAIKSAIEQADAIFIQKVGNVWTVFRKRHEDSEFPQI